MKKQNNRFRNGNNNNNNGYTLNYKFDSVSIAGKISGTALDLIRRYNDLAKEAQGCGNYVEMEVYRQYAEHYRKIVTDINERRNARSENQNQNKPEEKTAETTSQATEEKTEPTEVTPAANGYVETLPATETAKTFTVVEISEPEKPAEQADESKPKKVVRRRTTAVRKTAETKTVAPKAAEA
ncbi:MAG: DUF4167 domain-containing protein [Acetobacter sp.]|nr:DUF4167 domain-containing protein [Acetobacter sp.]